MSRIRGTRAKRMLAYSLEVATTSRKGAIRCLLSEETVWAAGRPGRLLDFFIEF